MQLPATQTSQEPQPRGRTRQAAGRSWARTH